MAFLKPTPSTIQLVIHVYGHDGDQPRKVIQPQRLVAGYDDVFDLLRRHPKPDRFLCQMIYGAGKSLRLCTCKFCNRRVTRMWTHLAKITRRQVTIQALPLCGEPECFNGQKFTEFLRELAQDTAEQATSSQKAACVSCGQMAQHLLPCPRCNVACYCSTKCEQRHRTEHKGVCVPSKYASICTEI